MTLDRSPSQSDHQNLPIFPSQTTLFSVYGESLKDPGFNYRVSIQYLFLTCTKQQKPDIKSFSCVCQCPRENKKEILH